MNQLSFQEIILLLQSYWQNNGCSILQSYDIEMGAATFHPATVLMGLSKKFWNVVYVQQCRRPNDSRFGQHPNRIQNYYQLQVILKPSPDNMQELFLQSLYKLGISSLKHDIRFVEDNWESPTLGAYGVGWEIWCNGMEIAQFTYMQQIAGIACNPIIGEITYGLERLGMYIQDIDEINNLIWSTNNNNIILYQDIKSLIEYQFSKFNLECSNLNVLLTDFEKCEFEISNLIQHNLPLPAYDYCIKANHIFNLLNARGVISVSERVNYISRIRNLTKICCAKWLELNNE